MDPLDLFLDDVKNTKPGFNLFGRALDAARPPAIQRPGAQAADASRVAPPRVAPAPPPIPTMGRGVPRAQWRDEAPARPLLQIGDRPDGRPVEPRWGDLRNVDALNTTANDLNDVLTGRGPVGFIAGLANAPGAVQALSMGNELREQGHPVMGAGMAALAALPLVGKPAARAVRLLDKTGDLTDDAVDQFMRHAEQNPEGFTLDPRTGRPVTRGGFMVGGVPGSRSPGPQKMTREVAEAFLRNNEDLLRRKGLYVGGWRDGDGFFHLDISDDVGNDPAKAQSIMRQRNERSAYNIGTQEQIDNAEWTELPAGTRRMQLSHMSPRELDTIDPKHTGTGTVIRGAERNRPGEPKMHYFVDGSGDYERVFDPKRADLVRHEVQADLKLWDSSIRDPQIDAARAKGPAAFERALKRAGYEGYQKPPYGNNASVVVLFDEQPVARRSGPGIETWERPQAAPEKQIDARSLEAPVDVPSPPSIGRGVFNRNLPPRQGTQELDPRLVGQVGPRAGASEESRLVAESPQIMEGLMGDAEKGMDLDGPEWYETSGIFDWFGQNKNAFGGANDWLNASTIGSAQSPTHAEIPHATVLRYARKHNISVAEAVEEMKRRYPGSQGMMVNDNSLRDYLRATEEGVVLPSSPSTGLRKRPFYGFNLRGGSPEGGIALDGKQRQRMLSLAVEDPNLRDWALAEMERQREAARTFARNNAAKKGKSISEKQIETAASRVVPLMPIKNADDYAAISSVYQNIAEALGLRSAGAGQAVTWVGGSADNNLRSSATGTYQDVIEDALAYKAKILGIEPTPRNLQNLWEPVANADDFLLKPPGFGTGGFRSFLDE